MKFGENPSDRVAAKSFIGKRVKFLNKTFTLRSVDTFTNGSDIYKLSGGNRVSTIEIIPENMGKIKVGDFNFNYYIFNSEIELTFKDWKLDLTMIGDDFNKFIGINTPLISEFFYGKINEKTDKIISDYRKEFSELEDNLKDLILPSTKEIVLSKIIEEYKRGATAVAKMFKDPTVKSGLLGIFRK